MAFDGETCLGAAVIENIEEVLNLLATSTDEVTKGYKSGKEISLEYHSTYDNTVYELVPKNIIMGSMSYEELGTLYAEFKATALSIEENVNTPNIKVYPNPVSQQLNIIIENSNSRTSDNLQLKLIDIKGSIVITNEYSSNKKIINLDVSGLISGKYTLVLSNSNMRFTQKVIKK